MPSGTTVWRSPWSVLGALVLVIAMVACGGPSPAPSPTPTPSASQTGPNASPNNATANPINLGTITCSGVVSATGDNLSGTQAWYEFTYVNTGGCQEKINVTEAPGGGDSFEVVGTSVSSTVSPVHRPGTPIFVGSSKSSAGSGTYYIFVAGGTTGVQFTVTLS